jgi:aspartyl-tRNA(Asn)/glutamyl-tRNA(Gln) amidotransferase subunit A
LIDHQSSMSEAGRRLRDRSTTVTALVARAFERIDELEPVFHAFISHDREAALDRASALDAELQSGTDRGPLHGIPVALKDNIATASLPTTFGSRIGRGFMADADATVVRRLTEAGAIVVGKNNMHEFALGPTNINAEYGDVPNPWNLDRVPGGSSGGSAVAVAIGEVFAALGSDSGGSVRMPAAMCGLVGLKPTHGRVSLRGLLGGAPTMDHIGPMTRTVEDAAIVHDAIAGHDPADPESLPGQAPPAAPGLEAGVDGLRIGLMANRSMGPLRADIGEKVKEAASRLEAAGAKLQELTVDDVEMAPYSAVAVAYPEVGAAHREWIRRRRNEYAADIRPLVDLGQIFSAGQYILAQRFRRHLLRRLDAALEGFDMLALPTTAVTAGRRDGSIEALEGDSGESALFTLIRFTVLFNMTGYPAISVPCGFDDQGLPIGIQLAGRPDSEPLLLRAARALEKAAPWPMPDISQAAKGVA